MSRTREIGLGYSIELLIYVLVYLRLLLPFTNERLVISLVDYFVMGVYGVDIVVRVCDL